MLQNQVLIQVSHRIQMFMFLPGREGKNRNSLAASGQNSAHRIADGGDVGVGADMLLQNIRQREVGHQIALHQHHIILILIYRINIRDQRNFFQESG